MENEELQEYIQKQLYQKGIDISTQDYIIEYIHMNQKLFGNILNVNKIVDRITSNLQDSIKTFNYAKTMNLEDRINAVGKYAGLYDSSNKKIFVNPLIHIIGYVSKNVRNREKSTIMHEIDHAATTTEYSVDEKQKDIYINGIADIMSKSNPNGRERTISELNDTYKKHGMKIKVTGISNPGIYITKGINLQNLNEGITAYKQELYDKFSGINSKTGYTQEKKLAKEIASVIGKETLISKQFDGDYEGIRQLFNEKTGQDLNYLVKELNDMAKYRDPISRFMYKAVRKIGKHKNIEALEAANENINSEFGNNKNLQACLAEQVNSSKEILMKDIEDISNQRNEININHQEIKKESDESIII